MRHSILLLTSAFLSTISPVVATPLPQDGSGAKSCDSDPLNADTWKKLKIDDFLTSEAKNLSSNSNNVQGLAGSFGAPNFFCGLDQFCNAGQPCVPVQLPAWYALVAVQNWNNYMNSMNTAISFASSIIAQTLPGIVSDIYKDPKDDVTPLLAIVKVITTVAGVVPFADKIASLTQSTLLTGVTYSTSLVKPPAPVNKFLAWSDVSGSIADVIKEYQASISTALQTVVDAKVGDKGGINEQLSGGRFLGVNQNFTQAELQAKMIDSFKVYSIGLALQAQKIFVTRAVNVEGPCDEGDLGAASSLCVDHGNGLITRHILVQTDRHDNQQPQDDIAQTLFDKYSFTKEFMLANPAKCYDQNNKKPLADPFNSSLPLDPQSLCLFNLAVCDNTGEDTIKNCRNAGLNI